MARRKQKYPASVARPEKMPMKKRRNIWTEPIHETLEGGSSRWVS
jgi:hypothetical protein